MNYKKNHGQSHLESEKKSTGAPYGLSFPQRPWVSLRRIMDFWNKDFAIMAPKRCNQKLPSRRVRGLVAKQIFFLVMGIAPTFVTAAPEVPYPSFLASQEEALDVDTLSTSITPTEIQQISANITPKEKVSTDGVLQGLEYYRANENWCYDRCQDLLFGPAMMLPENSEFVLRTTQCWCQWLLAKRFRRHVQRSDSSASAEDLDMFFDNDEVQNKNPRRKKNYNEGWMLSRLREEIIFIDILKTLIKGYYSEAKKVYSIEIPPAPSAPFPQWMGI